jgi:hypothetical protein
MPIRQFIYNFSFFDINNMDAGVLAANRNTFSILIKANAVCNVVSCIDTEEFLDHSDVPQFNNPI